LTIKPGYKRLEKRQADFMLKVQKKPKLRLMCPKKKGPGELLAHPAK